MWKYYALLSAFFAALTAIFSKLGVADINSNLATAIRTTVIFLLTWGIVLAGQHLGGDPDNPAPFLDFPCVERCGDRSVMAVLFQGIADRGRVEGRSCGQIERGHHDSAFIPAPERTRDAQSRHRSTADNMRKHNYACEMNRRLACISTVMCGVSAQFAEPCIFVENSRSVS